MSTVHNTKNQEVRSYSIAANSSSEVDKTAKKVKDKTGPSFWWAIAGTVALVGAIEFVCHILGVKDDTDPNKDYEVTGSY